MDQIRYDQGEVDEMKPELADSTDYVMCIDACYTCSCNEDQARVAGNN